MQANAELQERLQAMHSQPSPLALVQAKREENAKDRDKFKALLDNLQVSNTRMHYRTVLKYCRRVK